MALPGRHRPGSAELGVVEGVDEVGAADEEVQVEGPVLGRLEGAQAIQNDRLSGTLARAQPLVEEETVAAEALDLALDGGVADAELEGDLA
jgi:hypothetical protein